MAATLRENYNTTPGNSAWGTPSSGQLFQTFLTPGTGHTIISVKLYGAKGASDGTFYVYIRLADANHKPTGGNLTSGSILVDTISTTWPTLDWFEVSLTEINLDANTEYAIIMNSDCSLDVAVALKTPSPYADGYAGASTDGGSTWTLYDFDFLFEVWGNDISATNIKKVVGVVYASILKITGIAIASVKKIIGVS